MMSSSPPSPITMPLALPAVVSVLVKLRRTIDKSKGESLECSSGEPQTHPCLEGATDLVELPLAHSDVFTCKGAVDLPKLLRASRASLFDKAIYSGANVLHKERFVALASHSFLTPVLISHIHPTAGIVTYAFPKTLDTILLGFVYVLTRSPRSTSRCTHFHPPLLSADSLHC